MPQLPADCLNDIFEYLEDDKATLYSCLLVNRLWCATSVRLLWRDVQYYSTFNFSTLIACLPNDSKEILSKNGITISTPTSKPPMFNYAAFCKVLSIYQVYHKLKRLLKNQNSSISSQNLKNNSNVVAQEILRLFVKQIPSLRKLEAIYPFNPSNLQI